MRGNLPRKFMEQCTLPGKLGSKADFAPQNYGNIVSKTKKQNSPTSASLLVTLKGGLTL